MVTKKYKVFVIGLNKTGTTSLGLALSMLGYNLCPESKLYQKTHFEKINDGDFSILDKFILKYNAFQDRPWNHPKVYQYIDKNYDNCKFILTLRDSQKWIESCKKWNNKVRLNRQSYYKTVSKICYGIEDFLSDESVMLNTFNSWAAEIIEYFKNKDNLLLFDFVKSDNWGEICSFLNENTPNKTFPHANKTN